MARSQPLARVLDLVVRRSESDAGSAQRSGRGAAALVFAAPLAGFAVIPFGSRYQLGEQKIALVVADLDWGIVWLLCAVLLCVYGSIGLLDDRGSRDLIRSYSKRLILVYPKKSAKPGWTKWTPACRAS